MSNSNIQPKDTHRSILKSTSILSLGTLSSRILGFIRDIILARLLGTGLRADAFFVALKIPNLFRSFVGEGATNAAVVPVFSEYQANSEKSEFWRFVSVMLVLALMALSIITLIGILTAPLIVRLIAPGFMADPEKLTLTIRLTKLIFPYLVLIGLAAYSMAVLHSFRSFTAPAFSPCLFNLALIVGALFSSQWMQEPVFGLAGAVIVGGFLQLIVQVIALKRNGMRWYRPVTLRHPGAAQVGRLLVPRMIGAGVYQLTVFIDTFCASLAAIVGAGGISAIYYANRIIQFPMGLFSIALASAVLPTLSGLVAGENMDRFKGTLAFSLKNIFYVIFPASVLMILLAEPVIRALFERGAFDAYSTGITSSALLFYSLGLFSFSAIKILVSAFYALQDTKTPVKVAAVCLGINTVLNFILMFPMGIGGIALASSVAATADFIILFILLEKKIGQLEVGLRAYTFKLLLASVVMAGVVLLGWQWTAAFHEILRMVIVMVIGGLAYGWITVLLGVEQSRQIWRMISKRN